MGYLKAHLRHARNYNKPTLISLAIGNPSVDMDSVISSFLVSLLLKQEHQYTPVINCSRDEFKFRIDVVKHLDNFGIDEDFIS